MARKVSFSALESRSPRLRSKIRRRPYSGPSLARGISLMYRRNKTNGTWVLKASDGHGSYWTKSFALADDFEDADAKKVLTFYQAQDAAKRLARGEDGSGDSAPITVDGALKDYRRDLEARNANPYNAESPRVHLTKVLLGKPVQLLNAHELKKWRDGLLGKIAPATINRVCRCRGDSNCGFARRLPRSDADTVHSYSLTGRSSARTAVILAVQPPPIVFSTETRKHSAKSSDFTSLLSTCRRIRPSRKALLSRSHVMYPFFSVSSQMEPLKTLHQS